MKKQGSPLLTKLTTINRTKITGYFYGDGTKSNTQKAIMIIPGFFDADEYLENLINKLKPVFNLWILDPKHKKDFFTHFNITNMATNINSVVNLMIRKYHQFDIGVYANNISAMGAALAASRRTSHIKSLCLVSCPTSLKALAVNYKASQSKHHLLTFHTKENPAKISFHEQLVFDKLIQKSRKGKNDQDSSIEIPTIIRNFTLPTYLIYGKRDAFFGPCEEHLHPLTRQNKKIKIYNDYEASHKDIYFRIQSKVATFFENNL